MAVNRVFWRPGRNLLCVALYCCISLTLLAQNNHTNKKVTVTGRKLPIREIFKSISRQTGLHFFYQNDQLNHDERITVHYRNQPLDQVLHDLLSTRGVTWSVNDNAIILRPAPVSVVKNEIAQPRNKDTLTHVTGIVTDEEGNLLPGASVRVSDSIAGAMADANGYFELKKVSSNAKLTASMIGYEWKGQYVRARPFVHLKLTPSTGKLDEMVVIGYGTTTNRLNTGSVGKINAATIGRQPVANPLAALQGRVPGLFIKQYSGVPGSDFGIEIRGQNTLSGPTTPLYIIDGVPFAMNSLTQVYGANGVQNQLAVINPGDIKSMEVLKDADATAIYGSRGANGVILITTKSGTSGKPKLEANVYTGAGKVIRLPKFMNTQQYLEMRREAFRNDGITPTPQNAKDLLLYDTLRDSKWPELLIGGTSKITDAQLSLSGGNKTTRYRIGAGYHYETTVFPGDWANNRYNTAFAANHKSKNNKLNVSANIILTKTDNLLPTNDLSFHISTAPNAPTYDKDGNIQWYDNGGVVFNPLGILKTFYKVVNNNLLSNVVIGYEVLPGLTLKSNLGFTSTSMKESRRQPTGAYHQSLNRPRLATWGENNFKSWIIEPQALYQVKFGKAKLDFLAGASWQSEKQQALVQQGFGFPSDDEMGSLENATTVSETPSNNLYRYQAAFGRAQLNWENKYLLNLNARRDGSSRFGPNRQYANFWSVGAAWIFSEEPKFQQLKEVFYFGKLRASYGITGSDKIRDYAYVDAYGVTRYPYENTSGLQPLNLYNPDYAWETNRKFEAAMELGFFKDRIHLTASFFRNRSSNLLAAAALPIQTGFHSVLQNLKALVQNQGIELEWYTTNMVTDHFKWSTSFNVTFYKNKLLKYPGLSISNDVQRYKLGESLKIERVDQYTGVNPVSGLYTFKGSNLENKLVFDLNPQYYGGFMNNFTWKNWELELFFQFVKQYARNYKVLPGTPGREFNQFIAMSDRWQKVGDEKAVQRYSMTDIAFNLRDQLGYSDAAISDASYIRLKNLSLSYKLPIFLLQKIRLQSCKVYLQGQNLLTFTRYPVTDPENGIPNFLAPLKVMTGGLQITL